MRNALPLTGALQNTAAHDPPLFDTSKMAQLFREGTEMGNRLFQKLVHKKGHPRNSNFGCNDAKMGS